MKNQYLSIALSAAVGFFATTDACHAQLYTVDNSFGNSGRQNQTFTGSDYRTLAHLARPDGTSYAIATYDNNGCPTGRHCFAIFVFNSAGQFQGGLSIPNTMSFSKRTGGVVLDPFLVKAAAIDSQGRIVIVGSEQLGTVFQFKVIRLLSNGQPDTSFDGDGIATPGNFTSQNNDLAEAVAIDSNDRVIVAGSARFSANDTDFAVLRLTSAGALDTTFAGDGKETILFDLAGASLDGATAVSLRNGGQIYLAGFAMDAGVRRIGLAKMLPAGTLDGNFCASTCTFQGPYTSTNNGKRVLFYGNDTDNQNDFVSSLTVNISGEMVYAGIHQTGPAAFRVFAQKVALNGDYLNEGLLDTGLAGSQQYSVGGIRYFNPNSGTSKLVLTGSVGPDREFFFAQGLESNLVPTTNWSTIGQNSSVLLYTASGSFGDNPGDLPAIPSIDSSGRVLVGGSFKATSTDPNYSVTIMRLTQERIFRNGFE